MSGRLSLPSPLLRERVSRDPCLVPTYTSILYSRPIYCPDGKHSEASLQREAAAGRLNLPAPPPSGQTRAWDAAADIQAAESTGRAVRCIGASLRARTPARPRACSVCLESGHARHRQCGHTPARVEAPTRRKTPGQTTSSSQCINGRRPHKQGVNETCLASTSHRPVH